MDRLKNLENPSRMVAQVRWCWLTDHFTKSYFNYNLSIEITFTTDKSL